MITDNCSGDQARWLAKSGQLDFLGRNDSVVKLRGQRVDLGESDLLYTFEVEIDCDCQLAWSMLCVRTLGF